MQRISKSTAKRIFQALFAAYLLLSLWNLITFHRSNDGSAFKKRGDALFLNDKKSDNTRRHQSNPLEELSSVDYFACCGLGHRLIRMSNAYFIARQRNFSFRAFWGWCGERNPIEVFSYLFRPYSASEVAHVTSRNLLLPFYNDVGGFYSLTRDGSRDGYANHKQEKKECPCQEEKARSDLELYTSLRLRFRKHQVVEDFVKKHFRGNFVIGIHVRAGNGETGDFVNKGRGIDDPEAWVGHVVQLILDFRENYVLPSQSTVLYIATDTPSMIATFRTKLQQQSANSAIPVFDLPQSRPEEGQGVLFGEAISVHNKDNNTSEDDDFSACLEGWSDTMTDMFLLSHADVVIAGKPSSFSQTLPMSLAFGQRITDTSLWKNPSNIPVYCEVIPHHEAVDQQVNNTNSTTWVEVAPSMQCYHSYMEWCCNYSTWIKFRHTGPRGHTKIISREFIMFPRPEIANTVKDFKVMRNRTADCPRPKRGRAGGGRKDKCLPHDW